MPYQPLPQRLARFALLCSLCTLLAACGFQLRGNSSATALPESWRSLYLDTGNPNSEFSREVMARFSANGITWVESRDEAAFVLSLGPEHFSQRNLSLNREARAAEFELTMQTQFAVLQPGNATPIIEPSSASVVKQMENDPRNVVGKAEEIRILKGEMRSELAQQILRRIGFFAANATRQAG
ncbi:LPS assembly lipoprotein LptE [Parahaliea mediterranea]|uniref:LPS-assembly lipoprotein LptE n=1 Tax=Parahaliea mediterranea TaxID=651086 RepID=UPI000E2E704D|nr:LPS assembly lipoprotein LptE [Parahaliea mediterranea]